MRNGRSSARRRLAVVGVLAALSITLGGCHYYPKAYHGYGAYSGHGYGGYGYRGHGYRGGYWYRGPGRGYGYGKGRQYRDRRGYYGGH